MENTLIGPESGRMEQFHLVQFLDSFLDLPGAAWFLALLIYLFHSSKRGSEVRAPPRRNFRPWILVRPYCQFLRETGCGAGLPGPEARSAPAWRAPVWRFGLSEAFSPQWRETDQEVRVGPTCLFPMDSGAVPRKSEFAPCSHPSTRRSEPGHLVPGHFLPGWRMTRTEALEAARWRWPDAEVSA